MRPRAHTLLVLGWPCFVALVLACKVEPGGSDDVGQTDSAADSTETETETGTEIETETETDTETDTDHCIPTSLAASAAKTRAARQASHVSLASANSWIPASPAPTRAAVSTALARSPG
ncbi:MAG: hypothetical protein HC927_04035 [Deltaproteobacteria bacterium]|nr:hypothetical protein [Deltaproteobacteria bacterium]